MQRRFTLPTILGSLLVVIIFSAAAFLRAATPAPAPAGSGYHVIKTIPVGGEGGWDYVYVDSAARRVYVSRGTHVVVVDADTYAIVGDIPDTQGVHGIAVASDLVRGFTSNGRADNVTISLSTGAAKMPPPLMPRTALSSARFLSMASPNSPLLMARARSM